MKIKFIVLISLLVLVSQNVFAKGVGTTMFQILQMPATAYDGALANTTFSGESSAATNPAIIPFLKRSVILSHAMYLEDTSYSMGDINLMLNRNSGLNFGFTYFDYGSIDRYIDNGDDTYSKMGSFTSNDKVLSLSYGRRLYKYLYSGATLKYINQKIDDVSYEGFALSLSGLLFVADTSFISAGLNNLGPQVAGYDLPTNLFLGFSSELDETLIAAAQLDAYYNDEVYELKLAVEKNIEHIVFLRAGYVVPLKNHMGTNNAFLTNLTLGLGLKIKGFFIDYAWLPKGDLGNIHMFTIRVDF